MASFCDRSVFWGRYVFCLLEIFWDMYPVFLRTQGFCVLQPLDPQEKLGGYARKTGVLRAKHAKNVEGLCVKMYTSLQTRKK